MKSGCSASIGRPRHQQPVLRDDDEVAGLGRGLLGGVQHAHQFGGDLRLAGAGALHLGLAGEFRLHCGRDRFRIAARGADQTRRGALLVIEQGLEEVFGGDPLVEFADGNGRRGLQESPGAFGELLYIHRVVSLCVGDGPFSRPFIGNGNVSLWQTKWGGADWPSRGIGACVSNTCTAIR